MCGYKDLFILGVLLSFCFSYSIPCEYDKENKWKTQNTLTLLGREEPTDTLYGQSMFVDSKDGLVSKEIKTAGSFEPKGARAIFRLVKKGDIVMNVGSHIAMESMVIGKIIGPTGHLYIFQPFSVSFGIAYKNIYLNGLDEYSTIFNIGCGSEQTTGKIVIDNTNTGGSEIHYKAEPSTTNQVEVVYIDRLDNLLDGPINFMLMDSQFLEVECLFGMQQIIKNSPDIIMYVEWCGISYNSPNPKEREKEMLTWLKGEGFKFYLAK